MPSSWTRRALERGWPSIRRSPVPFALARTGQGISNFLCASAPGGVPQPRRGGAGLAAGNGNRVCRRRSAPLAMTGCRTPTWRKPPRLCAGLAAGGGGNSCCRPGWGEFPRTRRPLPPCVIGLHRSGVPGAARSMTWRPCCRATFFFFRASPAFAGIAHHRGWALLQQAIVSNGFAGLSTWPSTSTGRQVPVFSTAGAGRYYRNGSLTVVISPLQSLMKDQVDNLVARGSPVPATSTTCSTPP